MASYTSGSMHGTGSLGEVLTAGTTYSFRLTNRKGQHSSLGDCYLVLDGNGLATQQAGGSPRVVGPLILGQELENSSTFFTTTVNDTFTFDVVGSSGGDRGQIAITTVGGTFSKAVVTRVGEEYGSGGTITITATELIAGGFASANQPFTTALTADQIKYIYPNNTTISGSITDFNSLLNASSLVTSSHTLAIAYPNSGSSDMTAFKFTPAQTIGVNKYTIRSTGNFDLSIS